MDAQELQMRSAQSLGSQWPQDWQQACTSQPHKAKKSAGANLLTLAVLGSPTWARTKDLRLTDPGVRGRGRFTSRCTRSGARIRMYRHTRDILRGADYDPHSQTGMTLHEAREKAGELVRLADAGNPKNRS